MAYRQGFRVLARVALTVVVLGAGASRASDDTALPQWPEWQDPRIVEVNKQPPFATHFSFPSVAEARQNVPEKAANFESLDGQWLFKWAARPADAPRNFWRPDFDASDWKQIPVPSDWVRQGYGRYQYLDEEYLFPVDPPRVLPDDNPVGSYIKEFEVPGNWSGRRIFLHFGSVRTVFYLWVNGRKVGYSEDSRLPAEFDVTDYVHPGHNKLGLQVLQWADAAYLEVQDMWRMGGIERGVYLYSTPATHMRDVFMRATLDDHYRDGVFDLDVEVTRTSPGPAVGKLRMSLSDESGTVFVSQRFAHSGAQGGLYTLQGRLPAVRPWSAETPHLYNLLLELFDTHGALIEATSLETGFRKVEIIGGVLHVNGKPIMIRGVNRQEFDPQGMHVISRATMRRDVELMKQFNINALRLSHSPNDPYLYELADEYGLYLVDEANVESHGAMNAHIMLADREDFREAHLSRMTGMVERDKNHPAIIIWSLGNEAGSGESFRQMYRRTKARDPSRPIQYEAAGDVDYTDIYVPMYAKVWDISKYLATNTTHPNKPIILCEYAHMMGNSGGTIRDYWSMFYDHPQSQGGFVWDWVDQSLEVKQPDGSVYYGYGGDFERDKIEFSFADGIMSSLREPHPQAWDVKKAYEPVKFLEDDLVRGRVKVLNHYDFRGTTALAFSWRVEEDGHPIASGPMEVPDVAARDGAVVAVPLPRIDPRPGAEYFLMLEARTRAVDGLVPQGHLVAWEQFRLPVYAEAVASAASPSAATLRVTDERGTLSVVGKQIQVRFDKATGALVSLSDGSQELLAGPVSPHFWRAPTDNDIGAGLPEKLAVWRTMADSAVLRHFSYERQADGAISVHQSSSLGAGAVMFDTRYHIGIDGGVRISVSFDPGKMDLPFLPRLGLQLLAPATLSQLEWFGRGPQASYSDRWAAAPVGRYSGSVADQFHTYVRPQENGNKVDVRWMAVRAQDGTGLLVVGRPTFSGSALDVLDKDIDSPGHQLHSVDVRRRNFTVIDVDLRQMGLGGDDSWRSTAHPQYLISPRHYEYDFVLAPIRRGDDAGVLARRLQMK